jgi:hypothetical protein
MTDRIGFGTCSVLFLAFALVGAWASREGASPPDAWILDDPVRIITDFDPHEKSAISFRLHNTARVPLRIVGATAC